MSIIEIYYRLKRHLTLNNAVLALAAIVVLSSVWNTVGRLQKNFMLQQDVERLSQEIEIAQLESETLELQQQYLRSPEYSELMAREKLGKAAPGETVIILPELPPEVKTKKEPNSNVTSQREMPNIEKWFKFFFGSKAQT